MKPPAFQFYVRDWLADTELRMACASTRGIWIDCLCYMWVAKDRGVVTGTIKALANMTGSTPEEFTTFLSEASEYDFASVTCHGNVTDCHSRVTVKNRRMVEAEKDREGARLRKAKSRETRQCHKDVTPPSASASASALVPSPSSVPSPASIPEVPSGVERTRAKGGSNPGPGFEEFWASYPKRKGKAAAIKAWNKIKPDDELQQKILAAIGAQATTTEWTKEGGQFIPLPTSWLNGQRWDDEVNVDPLDGVVSDKTKRNLQNAQRWLGEKGE